MASGKLSFFLFLLVGKYTDIVMVDGYEQLLAREQDAPTTTKLINVCYK
ncbi:hypothetical protein [Okeania sp. KiyG1]|nr:hypothetical protein [Okeania sp. KiyG1]